MGVEKIPTTSYDLAYLELKKGALFDKIPKELIDNYITESLEIGKVTAEKYRNKSFKELLAENNISFIKKSKRQVANMVTLRGEVNFSNKKNSIITVYEDSLKSIVNDCNPLLPSNLKLDIKTTLDVHLAHEFFHYLEFSSGKTVSERLPKIVIGKFFKWERTAEIIQCSEIAAHSFSKHYCNLEVLPNYYDYVYLEAQKIN